jgi:hypothetical protein
MTVDTAKAAPTGGTVYYVDVIHCPTAAGDSAVSHRYSRLGDAVGSYTRSVTWQVQHTSVTGQVRMRSGRDGSAVTHLVRRHLKACHR